MGKRILREQLTIQCMIRLYQSAAPDALHSEATHFDQLYQYACQRLARCPFGEDKPACKRCPIHCYQPAKREEMKAVMRWAGPRMLWRHPILALRHLLDDRRPVPPLPEKYRRRERR
ncbi:nitrous oxide-stimulated promoter family protein [Edwardsiella piscicida]|uniref:nitrous oxide-stimulated promoter family protein n=1 Tax=Edwardsiella piscicida TaxID=1263550 RepID=UPI0002C07EA6|nr:nitrous oxide-stimulated promoter family protein [Edwardsiella piscicida]AGH73862.1 hypothetical protein ETAC_08705 [Edwardsiella piscicida C07-087]EKS7781125.1 nitrous oxide-stimulated promoter family protein [Edwardsiella piscicida]EKS7784354.1 nitrous oxide-stimulated promoter family protein [Edwardsiella piscicida]EKS7814126.1 nitrous oxide-stimulated promoter family protein [Edwardsiella piscicida]ELM3724485.1 nitrous oxide-stimulated promoter family protein [Edwardsiella piscicida]